MDKTKDLLIVLAMISTLFFVLAMTIHYVDITCNVCTKGIILLLFKGVELQSFSKKIYDYG